MFAALVIAATAAEMRSGCALPGPKPAAAIAETTTAKRIAAAIAKAATGCPARSI
jgi:hypothetical protein